MIHWLHFSVPIWLPTSGWAAFWLTCGGISVMVMTLFFIRENGHRQYMLVAYGIGQEPIGMSAWTIIKILLGGPITLLLGMVVTLRDQPRRHRKEREREQRNIDAYLSSKILDDDGYHDDLLRKNIMMKNKTSLLDELYIFMHSIYHNTDSGRTPPWAS